MTRSRCIYSGCTKLQQAGAHCWAHLPAGSTPFYVWTEVEEVWRLKREMAEAKHREAEGHDCWWKKAVGELEVKLENKERELEAMNEELEKRQEKAEAYLDKLLSTETKLYDRIIDLEAKLAASEAACAEMRGALVEYVEAMGSGADHHREDCPEDGKCLWCRISYRIQDALSLNAGRDYVHRSEIQKAVAEEREACLKIATERIKVLPGVYSTMATEIADAIRARGES